MIAQTEVHPYNSTKSKEDIMKNYRRFFLFTLVFLLACGTIPGLSPAATPTPEPSFTPPPTDTATPQPTATPNAIQTKEAQATRTTSEVMQELDSLLDDTDIPYQQGYLAWKYDQPISIGLTGPEQEVQALDDKLIGRNFIMKSDVTWRATGIIVCGSIFRSEPDLAQGKQYLFQFLRLSGLPAWSIDVAEFGRFKNSPTRTQFSSALLQDNGATNQFVLVAIDEQFTLYINHVRQGRFFDNSKQRSEGIFGFLAYQDSGKGSCEFENSWIWSLEPPPPGGAVIGFEQPGS
jgi:hypothetical protein